MKARGSFHLKLKLPWKVLSTSTEAATIPMEATILVLASKLWLLATSMEARLITSFHGNLNFHNLFYALPLKKAIMQYTRRDRGVMGWAKMGSWMGTHSVGTGSVHVDME